MPHSVSPEDSPMPVDEDGVLPDAPTNPTTEAESSQDESKPTPEKSANDNEQSESKGDVKLEDLFNDEDDEDEEFPSSSAVDSKMASSPSEAILYVGGP